MKKMVDATHSLFSPEEADRKALQLNLGDPDWNYKVVHDPKGTGYSFIEVYDENNEYIQRI